MRNNFNIVIDEQLATRLFCFIVKSKKHGTNAYKFNRDIIINYLTYQGILKDDPSQKEYNKEFARAYLVYFKNKGYISQAEKHIYREGVLQSYFEYRYLTSNGIEYAKQLNLL